MIIQPQRSLIFSRRLDPLFALFVGVSAAAVRINKDEKKAGRETEETLETLKRRIRLVGRGFGLGG
jgi:hypothetical protein